jgi:hypothetical protein
MGREHGTNSMRIASVGEFEEGRNNSNPAAQPPRSSVPV